MADRSIHDAKTDDDAIFCMSQPTFDGWTGERLGWLYGMHIISRMPDDRRCPVCGLSLEDDDAGPP